MMKKKIVENDSNRSKKIVENDSNRSKKNTNGNKRSESFATTRSASVPTRDDRKGKKQAASASVASEDTCAPGNHTASEDTCAPGKHATIELFVPASYEEMTPSLHKYILQFMCFDGISLTDAVTLGVYAENGLLPTQSDRLKDLTEAQEKELLYQVCNRLQWLETEERPFYVERIGKNRKVKPMWFDSMKLGEWLKMMNIYEGIVEGVSIPTKEYTQAEKEAYLNRLLAMHIDLVKCICPTLKKDEYQKWHAVLALRMIACNEKRYYRMFPELFKPMGQNPGKNAAIRSRIQEQYALIRTLSKGDVTKDAAVLDTPLLDCFLELQAMKQEESKD